MIISLDDPICLALSFLGTAVCAATGAFVAIRKQMDPIGALTLAVVTGIGGGTLRDILIAPGEIFWIEEPLYVWIAAATGLFIYLSRSVLRPGRYRLLVPDAIGLALFTWVGCEKSRLLELPDTAILIMGVLTGTAGGFLRDVISNEVPFILMPNELYATASILGGAVYLAAGSWGVPDEWVALFSIGTVLMTRLAAMRWNISLGFLTRGES